MSHCLQRCEQRFITFRFKFILEKVSFLNLCLISLKILRFKASYARATKYSSPQNLHSSTF